MDLFQEKEKDKEEGEEGRGGGRRRNLHLSLKWRDELGKSESISVFWRWVASFVSKKEWYLYQRSPNFLACLMTKEMAPQRVCKHFFQE